MSSVLNTSISQQAGHIKQRGWRLIVKRSSDFMLAAVMLLLASPVIILVAIAIGFVLGRPIVFRQERPGLNGCAFTLFKFRTMADNTDANGDLLPDEQRLNALGRFLRSFSLDELPQLWNVLKGDLSLVGPRPLLMEYIHLYSPFEARRHEVMPGITGWTQVNGRNALSWREKFALDIWYVDNWSLGLDIRILLKTLLQVAKRDGVSQNGYVTMPKFTGSNTANTIEPKR
jgi:lipopolysaccharide/colanic/teichoic acid biosynthesis glycosyltransferase